MFLEDNLQNGVDISWTVSTLMCLGRGYTVFIVSFKKMSSSNERIITNSAQCSSQTTVVVNICQTISKHLLLL